MGTADVEQPGGGPLARAPSPARTGKLIRIRATAVHDAFGPQCGMYVSMSRLRVEADRSDELVAGRRRRAGLVESHEGFIDLQVWRSDRDQSEMIMVSRWQNKNAFREYLKSADHRVSRERMDSSLRRAIKLERLESMQTYEVVAE